MRRLRRMHSKLPKRSNKQKIKERETTIMNPTRTLTHTNENCIGCGLCNTICPTNAIKMAPLLPVARGILKKPYLTINEDKCAECGMCAAACPFDALDLKIDNQSIKENPIYPKWNIDVIIDENNCLYCQQCQIACPQDAIKVTRQYPKRTEFVSGELEINEEECIKCGICQELCPAEAITVDRTTGKETIQFDKEKCVYCKVCKKACPTQAIKAICNSCMYTDDLAKNTITGRVIISHEDCINCGWCQNICPKETITVNKPFTGELIYNEEIDCKGNTCHACQDVCQCNAFTIKDGISKWNPDVCVYCGACQKACPKKRINVQRQTMNLENIRSKAWNKNINKILNTSK